MEKVKRVNKENDDAAPPRKTWETLRPTTQAENELINPASNHNFVHGDLEEGVTKLHTLLLSPYHSPLKLNRGELHP